MTSATTEFVKNGQWQASPPISNSLILNLERCERPGTQSVILN